MTITAKCARVAVSAAITLLLLALFLRIPRTPRQAAIAPLAPRTPTGPSIPPYRRLIPLSNQVEDIAFSPSGNRMAVVMDVNDDYGMRLQLWDTRSWTPLRPQKAAARIDAIAFSPDGSILAAVDGDSLTMRDPLNGRLRRSIRLRKGMIDSMAFSPGGDRLAIGYDDGGVEVLRASTMRVERSLEKTSKDLFYPGNKICFSPDGGQLAVCRIGGFRIYNTATWAVQREVKTGVNTAELAFVSNGQLAVTDDSMEHNWVTIYDPETGMPGKRLKSTAGVESLAVSRDGKMVGIGGGGTMQLWDAATGHLIRAVDSSFTNGEDSYGEGGVNLLVFGPRGRLLAVAVPGGIEIWNVDAVRRHVPPKPLARPFLTLRGAVVPTFAPRGHLLATIADGRIHVWDTRTWRRLRSLHSDARPDGGGSLTFSRDGRLLACGGGSFLEVWDVKKVRLRFRVKMPYSVITGLSFSPDGRIVAAGGGKAYLTLWSTGNGKVRRTIETPDWPYSVAYSPDGRRLAMGNKDGAASWNTRNWRPACGADTARDDAVEQLLYSPDGRFLAAGIVNLSDDKPCVVIWDAHSGRRLRRLDGQTLIAVNGFARDGRSLVTTGPDKRMETWNTGNWRLEQSANDPRPVNAAAISPDGALIAGTDDDSIDYLVTIWKRQPPQ